MGRVQTLLNSSYKTTMEVQILTSKTHSAANAALPLSQVLKTFTIPISFNSKTKIKLFLIFSLVCFLFHLD